jgi:hypothetical protein
MSITTSAVVCGLVLFVGLLLKVTRLPSAVLKNHFSIVPDYVYLLSDVYHHGLSRFKSTIPTLESLFRLIFWPIEKKSSVLAAFS